ncbi:MAG: PhnD/SsuA/transferrin family substrate-binding protein [Burkholderiales bacterium]|nr:PhnD/SsuA/transferrin family substrate-binding protein [Burkholderiales bacterium]
MRRLIIVLAALGLAAQAPGAFAQMKLGVSGEAREEIKSAAFQDRYAALAAYLAASTGAEMKLTFGRDLTTELQRTRTGYYDLMVGPAHVIGSAMRYGYEPIAQFPGEEQAVFVASKASGVKSLAGARGKVLALPPGDALATYLALGELNAMGFPAKSFFREVKEFRYHEVALLALEMGQADIAVADRRLAEAWMKANGGHVLHETRTAPATGVAVNKQLDTAAKERIRAAFLSPSPKFVPELAKGDVSLAGVKPIAAGDYKYVSTLGYFTPTVIGGAQRVGAEEVVELMKRGATLVDTRSADEYRDAHIRGAKLVPYHEKSRKEIDFDAKADSFELQAALPDKAAPVIFACNGAECWKSYKAATVAVRAGYKNVYWFRGGFPEWKQKDLPIAGGS